MKEKLKKMLSYLNHKEKIYFSSVELALKYVPKSNSMIEMYLLSDTIIIESGFEDYHKNDFIVTHTVFLVDEDDIKLAFSILYKNILKEFRAYCESEVLKELTDKKIEELLK